MNLCSATCDATAAMTTNATFIAAKLRNMIRWQMHKSRSSLCRRVICKWDITVQFRNQQSDFRARLCRRKYLSAYLWYSFSFPPFWRYTAVLGERRTWSSTAIDCRDNKSWL